ncbi:hypothetical protein SERLA73DRAFT_128099 [Serpula lacrymans var. lacrymans S7.3]|uniref:CxC2-like cysteine cluster KDZ transposase-associated domain-containing protein n=2 Tax=Serpula lacrymans var. lacrymans TaxID=341189 RepID=F8QJ79_SERL3|nr:uncharacterized protein SERLADRAFT_365100 [Serpula lacrymans var. lacrymans S7.9]EGN91642.1 hypothetical protein SERLA73DRAFT_128099 [Serpula lacrymans var. lacrymans S7.3]EGO29044.1 hypothetical protein SERLADRAFT_365100 [Serpula lacrymans var. lacrymans S7.9]
MLLVDRSGVHHPPVKWCSCLNAACSDVQLLSNGLYPASQKKPQTAFTFALLDDFLINNKECKTPAMTFYSKIQRVTNSAFPHKVPNRYQEFMRVSQQLRYLKYMWSLALFCLAFPQLGINVLLDWKQDPLRQYHLRTFVMDRNFNTECMKSKNTHDDVPFADGTAFLTANQPYMEHLKIAKKKSSGRVLESPYLQVPSGVSMYKGIGLFHVHGHQDICFPRYAPNFIPGAGQVDGGISETLWAPLNEVSQSTRAMRKSHKQEILDNHMGDSN